MLARLRTASLNAVIGIQDELEGVVARIRTHWPGTRNIVATDSGFCRDDVMTWCEDAENVDHVPGLAKNGRLKGLSDDAMAEASAETRKTGQACRRFCEFTYRTRKGWFRARRVIAKAEALPGPRGEDETDYPYKENNRYTGAVYRASGWIHVGATQGRGHYDRYTQRTQPTKDIWLRPLRKDWTRTLNR